jgi:guanylate kinase
VTPVPEGGPPVIFVIFGPGGVGKGTLVARLLQVRDGLWLSRSWTTRPRRPVEREDAYVFTTEDAFRRRVAEGGFLEWNEFVGNGHLYGTPSLEAPPGRDIVLEIDVNGARQVARRHPDAVMVYIAVPSAEVQEQRLRARGDADAAVARRLALGAEEDVAGRELADYVVVNDDLERASLRLAGIVDECRAAHGKRRATGPSSVGGPVPATTPVDTSERQEQLH